MERNKQVRVCKIGSLCSVFFWLIFIVIVFLWQKQKREETMSNLFDKAIQIEKSIYIKRLINEQVHSFPTDNNIPKHEKDEWIDQYYLIRSDPKRERLDSIYSALLNENGIKTDVQILCTFDKTSTFTGAMNQIEKAVALPSVSFSINDDEEKNIVLSPYYTNNFLCEFLIHPYSYLSFFTCLFICLVFIWCVWKIKKTEKEFNQMVDIPVQKINLDESSIPLYNTGWIFHHADGMLKNEEGLIIHLTPLDTKYLAAFLKSEKHLLRYIDICRSIYNEPYEDESCVTRVDKQRIGQAINRLRKLLVTVFGIEIRSIRNGYELNVVPLNKE